jgi:peroxiredoxin
MPIDDNKGIIDREKVVKRLELDRRRKELATLQTRFDVGELPVHIYLERSKNLIEKIDMLEKEIKDLPISMIDRFRKNRALFITIAAVLFGVLLCVAVIMLIPRPGNGVGNIAPDFVMQLSDDNSKALSSFRGNPVVLVFWDRDFWDDQFFYVNGVGRKLYMPDKLNQLYQKSGGKDPAIIAIASGASSEEIEHLVIDYEIAYPVIGDMSGKLRSSYNISYEPTFVFLDKNGIIRARVEGPYAAFSDLEQAVLAVSTNTRVKQSGQPISDVIIQSNNEKSTVVNWSTAQPSTTQVDIDGKNIQTVITAAPVTLHSLIIKDLEPGASYHIRILYNITNINVSEHSFSALMDTVVSKRFLAATSSKDTSYPEISGAGTISVTDSAMIITWKTDEPASGEVDYGLDKNYRDTASQGNNLSIWHTVKIANLLPETQYYLKLRSKDTGGKESTQELQPDKTQGMLDTGPFIGKRAPDFTLTSLDGTKYSLSQFAGRKVLLNFWLEGCRACEAEMPLIQAIFNKYGRDEVIVLAVNVRGDVAKVKLYAGTEAMTFPILLDTEGTADGLYKSPAFPTTFFIDSTGIIRSIADQRFQTTSEIDDALGKLDCCP